MSDQADLQPNTGALLSPAPQREIVLLVCDIQPRFGLHLFCILAI